MNLLIPALVYGVVDGSLLAVAALGFTLQFGVTNYINFAYAAFLTLSAYMAYTAESALHVNFWFAALFAVIFTGAASFLVGQYLFSPFFRKRPQLLYGLTVTFAGSMILENLLLGIWGSYLHEAQYPAGALAEHSLFGVNVTTFDIALVVLAAVVFVGVHMLLNHTKTGHAMRAVADNRELAQTCGLRVNRLVGIAWLGTGLIAGVSGIAAALYSNSFDPTLGDQYFYLIVAAVILGGIGRPYGALLGALVVGIVGQLAALTLGIAYAPVCIFGLLVLLMLVRPDGIFGASGRSVFIAG